MTLIEPEVTWFDAGTADALLAASNYVADVERRENALVACPEEIALQRGPIERHQFARLASTQMNSDYGRYLTRRLD